MESAWPEIWTVDSVEHRVFRGVRCAVIVPRKSKQVFEFRDRSYPYPQQVSKVLSL
jgi:hypothetical protein